MQTEIQFKRVVYTPARDRHRSSRSSSKSRTLLMSNMKKTQAYFRQNLVLDEPQINQIKHTVSANPELQAEPEKKKKIHVQRQIDRAVASNDSIFYNTDVWDNEAMTPRIAANKLNSTFQSIQTDTHSKMSSTSRKRKFLTVYSRLPGSRLVPASKYKS